MHFDTKKNIFCTRNRQFCPNLQRNDAFEQKGVFRQRE